MKRNTAVVLRDIGNLMDMEGVTQALDDFESHVRTHAGAVAPTRQPRIDVVM